ncbi:MAG TPA: SDR family NAD(P)-dependent oxidoreductase [Ramlibacter sp.]|uniref:SDR family NAD(P)-dependent oxidoreductase n=1 Tax=Ramlibacter sp. TaxID=1917967 RepID=UPI002ED62CBA
MSEISTTGRDMRGKVAIVTGAGRGIGREIALLLAARGASVVVNDVGVSLDGRGEDNAPAQTVVREIEQAGGRAVGSNASVSAWASARGIVQQALDSFGRIDYVVNNAGILRDKIFHQMDPADFEAVIGVHLMGTFYVSRAAAEHFRKQESGAFVHMTSTSGLIGSIGQANYAAAKMGIVGLSRSLALEMQRFNVRSNCIAPSAFSRMIESIPGATPEEQARNLELRRARTRPEQIAPIAGYLLSDAASHISGQIVGVRGNELYLYSQPRPVRILQNSEGWTEERLRDQVGEGWKKSFVPLERTRDVFPWQAQ